MGKALRMLTGSNKESLYKFNYFAIALDDGYLRQYSIAKIFNRFGIKVTIYCITHLKKYNGKPLLVTRPSTIVELFKNGNEIASHSCTHPNLLLCETSMIENELKKSKEFLENLLGTKVVGFAYPHGLYNLKILNIAAKYYYYARGYDYKIGRNSHFRNRFALSAIGLISRKLLALPILRGINVIIVIHDEGLPIILLLLLAIRFLRLMPHNRVVTVSQLVKLLE